MSIITRQFCQKFKKKYSCSNQKIQQKTHQKPKATKPCKKIWTSSSRNSATTKWLWKKVSHPLTSVQAFITIHNLARKCQIDHHTQRPHQGSTPLTCIERGHIDCLRLMWSMSRFTWKILLEFCVGVLERHFESWFKIASGVRNRSASSKNPKSASCRLWSNASKSSEGLKEARQTVRAWLPGGQQNGESDYALAGHLEENDTRTNKGDSHCSVSLWWATKISTLLSAHIVTWKLWY